MNAGIRQIYHHPGNFRDAPGFAEEFGDDHLDLPED